MQTSQLRLPHVAAVVVLVTVDEVPQPHRHAVERHLLDAALEASVHQQVVDTGVERHAADVELDARRVDVKDGRRLGGRLDNAVRLVLGPV